MNFFWKKINILFNYFSTKNIKILKIKKGLKFFDQKNKNIVEILEVNLSIKFKKYKLLINLSIIC